MPEERNVWRDPKSEQPNNPENPPQVLLRPEVRRAALMSYLGPVIALFVIIGLALIYWANRGPVEPDPNDRVADAIGTIGGRSAGGFDPTPDFDRTRDELAYRGGNATLTSVSDVIAATRGGRLVELNGAEVVSIDANVLQIGDGDARVRVIVTEGTQGVKAGDRVDLSGVTEQSDSGMQIRAKNIRAKH